MKHKRWSKLSVDGERPEARSDQQKAPQDSRGLRVLWPKNQSEMRISQDERWDPKEQPMKLKTNENSAGGKLSTKGRWLRRWRNRGLEEVLESLKEVNENRARPIGKLKSNWRATSRDHDGTDSKNQLKTAEKLKTQR